MDIDSLIDTVSAASLGEGEQRFFGALYPHDADHPTDVYTIKCQMISTDDGSMPTVEVTYSLLDFKFKNGESICDTVNWQTVWKIIIAPLKKICVFDAKCEKIGDNKYSLTNIRTVCYI